MAIIQFQLKRLMSKECEAWKGEPACRERNGHYVNSRMEDIVGDIWRTDTKGCTLCGGIWHLEVSNPHYPPIHPGIGG